MNWWSSSTSTLQKGGKKMETELTDLVTLTPHGWGIAHDKKQKFGVNSSFKSVTIGFLWY